MHTIVQYRNPVNMSSIDYRSQFDLVIYCTIGTDT